MKRILASLILPVMLPFAMPMDFDGVIPFPATSADNYESEAAASMLMRKNFARSLDGFLSATPRVRTTPKVFTGAAPVQKRGNGHLCRVEIRGQNKVTVCN